MLWFVSARRVYLLLRLRRQADTVECETFTFLAARFGVRPRPTFPQTDLIRSGGGISGREHGHVACIQQAASFLHVPFSVGS
jgi:hypothetical protein